MTSTLDTIERQRGRKAVESRARIMRRDCGLFQQCKRNNSLTMATQVDHIVAITNGGDDSEANKEALCDECHRIKTIEDLGFKVPESCDTTGHPTSKTHHWNKP